MHPNDPDNDGRPGAEDLAIADNYIARLEAERDNLKERLQFCASRILPWKCTMGVGCDEAGVCYAAAHGQPERCESALATPSPEAAGSTEAPVGQVGSMPGTDGFTMAVFKAAEVPIGTLLYVHARGGTNV